MSQRFGRIWFLEEGDVVNDVVQDMAKALGSEREVQLKFCPGLWLTPSDRRVLVMWWDGDLQLLTAREAVERDAGRGMFKWAWAMVREQVWGAPMSEDEQASQPGVIR